ncbi:hypothetical protein ES319_A12G227600v1 [Gossypium barbadense]|uniref:Uncharacterized protein n=1 Tax=Gossypium barbadense TaxID=3634 RepID=A0A5J5TDU1_GOSBA|nr:hypothetical protein ES319_A12G227600v1 [Gossypium barbadense]
MGKLGCGIDGVLNEAKFSEPLPWIGVYIAAASLACALAMAADVIHGFRHSKLWFPCKFSTINATSLTIIAVAVKLSVDLNTPMPRGQDQLAKLSSAALICTAVAVGMGTIAPAMRWFLAINFRCPTRGRKKGCNSDYKLEEYWIKALVEMKECPLSNIPIHHPRCRRILHDAKIKLLNVCIGIQAGIVFMSKVIRFVSVYFMGTILLCYDHGRDWLMKFAPNSIRNDSGPESPPNYKQDLSRFVLHLEGEDALVDLMMKENRDATDYWWRKAKKRQPKHLMELLELSRPSEGFKGLTEFDSFKVPPLDTEEAPNCWSLSLVTLTSIAFAVPNIDGYSIKHLITGVNEGLVYVRSIEHMHGKLVNNGKAADIVWLSVELYHRWLNVDLRKLSLQGKSTKEILEVLSDSAKNIFMEFKKNNVNMCLMDSPSKWPIKVLAANSMYRISQSLLLDYKDKNYETSERLFEAISVMVSDILAACLTNLQCFISIKCSTSAIEEREESVRHAAHVLGKTEKVLKLLHQKSLPGLTPDQMAVMDEWRSLYKLNSYLCDTPHSELSSPTPREVYLIID